MRENGKHNGNIKEKLSEKSKNYREKVEMTEKVKIWKFKLLIIFFFILSILFLLFWLLLSQNFDF